MTLSGKTVMYNLLREFKKASTVKDIRKTPLYSLISSEYKRNELTDEQTCKAQQELKHVADYLRCYFESSRKFHEIRLEYHGKTERTVEQTATMVGFKLPHDPK
ncbi:protein FMC1 homolog [Artemia franciscana]|uniref:Protein FMC1 homolog n=1 Tax=Artemia franciscana TaxID=6661 RepID=A0AA88HPV8_ARTSF|nr:hypothetical protein QYM36_011602 [Artemia franciscana]